jgi:hypothetical protein
MHLAEPPRVPPNGAMSNERLPMPPRKLNERFVFAKWNFVNYTNWDFVNYTMVYHFYNITDSPLVYTSKISVASLNTISLNRFYGRSIHCRRSAIGINLAYRTIVFFCCSYMVSWGFTSRVRAPPHGNFPSRRAGDGSDRIGPKIGSVSPSGRAPIYLDDFSGKTAQLRGYQVRWLAWLANHTALNRPPDEEMAFAAAATAVGSLVSGVPKERLKNPRCLDPQIPRYRVECHCLHARGPRLRS